MPYQRDNKTMLAPPELKKIHPLGKSPVITDGDTTVAESGAIIDYIVERYAKGRLVPKPGTPDATRYRFFMHYAEGSLMPYLLFKLVCNRVKSAPLPFFIKPVARKIADGVSNQFVDPNLKTHLAFLESELAKSTWFAGDFTAADIQMSYPVESAVARAAQYGVGDKLRGFVERIHARPAFNRAIARGGPYELLG